MSFWNFFEDNNNYSKQVLIITVIYIHVIFVLYEYKENYFE